MPVAENHQRINITLPPRTLELIDRLAPKGNRSMLIEDAIQFYVKAKGREKLRRFLKEGAVRRGERDRLLAEEWFKLGEESGESKT